MPSRKRLDLLVLGLLATAAGCGGGDLTVPSTTGTLEVTTATSGSEQDGDGYSVRIDAGAAQAIGTAATLTMGDISPGNHTVQLADVAPNCTVSGENPRTTSVTTGETATIAFVVSCAATSGNLSVTAATSGPAPDPDGYSVSVDGIDRGALSVNAAVTIAGLTPGAHVVGLTGLAGNCEIQGDNLRIASINEGANTTIDYTITCTTPPPGAGTLQITTVTIGSTTDPDGYTYAVDGGAPNPIAVNGTASLANVSPGVHAVRLAGVAANCEVQGDDLQSVSIVAGETSTVTFNVNCVPPAPEIGELRITTVTGGPSQDGDGYQFTVDGGQTRPIGANTSATLTSIAAGSHEVTLSGVAANCDVQGGSSKSITVPPNGTGTVTFNITCHAVGPTTGSIRVTTSTSGSDEDGDGYRFAIDGGAPQPIGSDGSETVNGIAPGTHEVVLSDVAANCVVENGSSKTAPVAAGATTTLEFTITCSSIQPSVGAIRVTTTTSGFDLDGDGYQFAIDGGTTQSIGINGSQTADNVSPGNHEVTLSGVAGNCSVDDDSKGVVVTPENTAEVTFSITCTPIPPATGAIRVTTTTSGDNPDPDGYQFTIDGGSAQAIGPNANQTVSGLSTGNHGVILSGVADNCEVDDDSEDATVTPGGTTDVSFTITCTSTGPSASRSDVSVDPDAIPAGSGSSTVRVVVQDADGDPLSGILVTPSASGGGTQFSPTSAVTGSDGLATFTFSATEAGDKTITIDAGGVTLEETEVITVVGLSTTTTITGVAPEPSTSGEAIHVTWQVSGEGGGTPTGTVTVFSFTESGVGCTVDVSQGFCDFVLNVEGTHALEAVYSGDAQFEDSSDATAHAVAAPPVGP
jgi:hypothetical protein